MHSFILAIVLSDFWKHILKHNSGTLQANLFFEIVSAAEHLENKVFDNKEKKIAKSLSKANSVNLLFNNLIDCIYIYIMNSFAKKSDHANEVDEWSYNY